MRWVLTTPLGSSVEPEVKRNLTIVSGPVAACAASACGPGSLGSRFANDVIVRPSRLPLASTTSTPGPATAWIARA